ncbi:MAG: class I SAM-dependent methyltransferase [Mycobacteriaceae bacterium]
MNARPVTPVGILAETLAQLSTRLGAVPGVPQDLTDDLRRAVLLGAGLEQYAAQCTTEESPELASVTARTAAESWDDRGGLEEEMLSGHVEGQLLKFLVHLSGARRVLEVGMFTGYSALAMAEALPADGVVVACEIDARVAALAQECFDAAPDGHKVQVRVAPAADTLTALAAAGERFDLVFLDADKGGYSGYLRTVLETDLLAEGGTVCVDNTLMQGQPWTGRATPNGAAIAEFNQELVDDPTIEQVLLSVRDGLTLLRRV